MIDRCRHDGAKGLEVSPRSLRQDQLVECQIGNRFAQALVLLLKLLELPELVAACRMKGHAYFRPQETVSANSVSHSSIEMVPVSSRTRSSPSRRISFIVAT